MSTDRRDRARWALGHLADHLDVSQPQVSPRVAVSAKVNDLRAQDLAYGADPGYAWCSDAALSASRCFKSSISTYYPSCMRTTLSLDDDVAAAVQRLREERHIGLSDAVNELIRAGLAAPARRAAFRQRTANLGLRVDVSNVADALERLDGPEAR